MDNVVAIRNLLYFVQLRIASYRMPMTDGQPDFAWADEQDAVLAIKHGDDRLFINFYYRAERAINGIARLQEITPTIDRIATVRTQFQVPPSGHTYTRPDWMDAIRSRGMPPPGPEIRGKRGRADVMPIAPRPAGCRAPRIRKLGPLPRQTPPSTHFVTAITSSV